MPKNVRRPSPCIARPLHLREPQPSRALPVSFGGICSLVLGLGRIFTDRRQKGAASTRRRNLAIQNRLKRYHLPEQNPGGIIILVYDRARQIDSSKEASGPGIGQDFRSQLYIGGGSGVASDWTCRS